MRKTRAENRKPDEIKGEKGLQMLASQAALGRLTNRQGGRDVSLAELRAELGDSSKLKDEHRQRLKILARRLARVRALGSEFARLDMSEHVTTAMDRRKLTV